MGSTTSYILIKVHTVVTLAAAMRRACDGLKSYEKVLKLLHVVRSRKVVQKRGRFKADLSSYKPPPFLF